MIRILDDEDLKYFQLFGPAVGVDNSHKMEKSPVQSDAYFPEWKPAFIYVLCLLKSVRLRSWLNSKLYWKLHDFASQDHTGRMERGNLSKANGTNFPVKLRVTLFKASYFMTNLPLNLPK